MNVDIFFLHACQISSQMDQQFLSYAVSCKYVVCPPFQFLFSFVKDCERGLFWLNLHLFFYTQWIACYDWPLSPIMDEKSYIFLVCMYVVVLVE